MPERDRVPLLFRILPFGHPGSHPRRLAVDLFGFATWVYLLVLLMTALWPFNVPLLALAYKISLGKEKMPFETGELWWRTFLAGLGLAVLSVIFYFIGYLVVVGAELAEYRSAVCLILLLGYIPAAVGFLFWAYAYDDLFGPLAVFALYILIPGLPLIAVFWLIRHLGTLHSLLP